MPLIKNIESISNELFLYNLNKCNIYLKIEAEVNKNYNKKDEFSDNSAKFR